MQSITRILDNKAVIVHRTRILGHKAVVIFFSHDNHTRH
jgi:hypothetical protein